MDKYGRPLDHQDVQMQYMQQQQQPMQVERVKQSWGWCTLVTAIISMCCCAPLGFCATVCAIMSYTDHKVMDYDRHKTKRCCSICCSVFAILFFCAWVAALVVLLVVYPQMWVQLVNSAINQANVNVNLGQQN